LRLRAALKRTNALGILSALALPLPAAAESIWGGSGSTSATTDYNTATNWSNPPGVAPISAGTSAVFANSGPGTVNVSAAVSPNSWTFATNAQSYTITGANVTFNTGTGLIDNANAGQSISIDNSLGGAGRIQLNGDSTLHADIDDHQHLYRRDDDQSRRNAGAVRPRRHSLFKRRHRQWYVRYFRFGNSLQGDQHVGRQRLCPAR
jgi:hypothetical protein